jgi:hypothetical protein
MECTLKIATEKKSEHIRSQVKSVQMNVKSHVLETSKNGQTSKQVKTNKPEKTEKRT